MEEVGETVQKLGQFDKEQKKNVSGYPTGLCNITRYADRRLAPVG